jgi:Cytochrome bd terminal oxidase subunit I
MIMNVEVLSRVQFALTISFHFLFPPLTIGLGAMLVIMQALRLRTGSPLYHDMARFWTRVFGLIFALGVASGIPMQFQFGTNWARYARFVGDIFGSLGFGAGDMISRFPARPCKSSFQTSCSWARKSTPCHHDRAEDENAGDHATADRHRTRLD